jgi:predicted dehydrogenase
VIEDACEDLQFYPRNSIEWESYKYLGGMRAFGETFKSRIGAWIDQIEAKTPYDKIDGSGEDGLKVQRIIEAAIRSWETHTIVDL